MTITTTQGHVRIFRFRGSVHVNYTVGLSTILIATIHGDPTGAVAEAIAGKFGDLLGELDQYAAKIVAESEGETP